MNIGVSYDQGSPKYRLYVGALLAAAERSGLSLEARWLAKNNRSPAAADLESVDGLVLTGGADVEPERYGFADVDGVCVTAPGRDESELQIIECAFARRIPILAICRGMQLLNVFKGGTLTPHLPTTPTHRLPDEARHAVSIVSGTTLSRIAGCDHGDVTSSHHQAVARLGEGLRAAAFHVDGTIEAIEWEDPLRKPWLAAVQWHPERMSLNEPLARELYRAFFQAVALVQV